jgi:predicted TIM-barrel fold metal-dependent hydrolase
LLPRDAPLISVNDHLFEPADLWTSRLPRRVAEQVPRVVRTESGLDAWRFGSQQIELPALSILADKPSANEVRLAHRSDEVMPSAFDPIARLAAMDGDGVAVHTLLPHACGFAGQRLAELGDAALWADCVRAYNDFLLGEFCAVDPMRLLGIALLPLADPQAAAEEIERVARLGARGLSFPHDPAGLGLPGFGSETWQPLFAAAEAADLPLFIHLGTGARVWAGVPPEARPPLGVLLTLVNVDVMQAASELAFSPVFTRHPRLRALLIEGGAGWLPYLRERMDYFWRRREDVVVPGAAAEVAPSEILRSHVWTSLIDDPAGIRQRAEIGVDRLVWQSDFPHSDSFWPDSRGHLEALLADVPDEEARAIAGGNARALLGLDRNV